MLAMITTLLLNSIQPLVHAENYSVGTWKTAQTIQPFNYGEGVEVKPFTNPGDMKTALLSEDLDFTGTTWVTAIMAYANGEPIKVVASMTEKCSALVVGQESGIEKVEDLKGKTIAYVPGTMHHLLLLETLDRAGLSPEKDVSLVNIDFFDMGQALASGSIDAFLSGEPYPSMAEIDGYGKVLEYPYYEESYGFLNAAMITTDKEIKENPDKIQALVNMHVESTKDLMENKEKWVEMAAEFGTEENYIEKSTENIDLSWDISEEQISQLEYLAQRMHELGMIETVPEISEMLDLTFLEKVS
ncbi:ABC transporter substrate-binding protein [Facklamia sp. DSM 111018]|uniref:ABC transporter substrate-binding protein n=2 Tax=Facklamia lactis TaxID=2749967 RepID=A0ABS0LQB7_9LACT|nr:ABC transporter substrate-binding protein [Facklamia lactis]MBG9985561.1 ABC transporter substrate-binding protein [Facklamia lactis]